MTWNYRIVHYRKGGYGLHEVYYDDDDTPWGMTAKPVRFECDEDEGMTGITGSLSNAMDDARRSPVFQEPKKGKWPGKAPSAGKAFRLKDTYGRSP